MAAYDEMMCEVREAACSSKESGLTQGRLCRAGTVNGVQSSLQNLLQALSYAAGLVLWRPEQFVWLMLGSVVAVAVAAALYAWYAVGVKGDRVS